MKKISVAKDFSEFPAGREPSDGPNSGQRFRLDLLVPGLKSLASNEQLEVDLDDTLGYGSSFLEEAFGGLVRDNNYRYDQLEKILTIKDSRLIYARIVWSYIEDEDKRLN